MCLELRDLVTGCGSANPPGIEVRLYITHKDNIDVFPERKAASATIAGESAKLDGDITLLPNKKWSIFDIVTDTGEVKDTLVGSAGSKAWESLLEGVIPTTGPEVIEWFECNANGCLVVLAKEKSGVVRVLGSKLVPAILESAEATTGKTTGDTHGVTLTIKSTTGLMASVYEGVIDLDATT